MSRSAFAAPRLASRLTLAGWAVLALLAGLLVTAANYSNNLLYAYVFLLASLFGNSVWQGRRNLQGLTVRLKSVQPVFADQPLPVAISVLDAEARHREALYLQYGPWRSPPATLAGETSLCLQLAQSRPGRGVWRVQDAALVSRYPFGLIETRLPCPDAAEALVYPSPLVNAAAEADARQTAQGGAAADAFAGVRAYQPGDNLSRINWKAYARREQLLVNLHDGAAGLSALWLDYAAQPASEKETRLRLLAGAVLAAHDSGRDYGLRLPGGDLAPGRGPEQLAAALAALARFERTLAPLTAAPQRRGFGRLPARRS